MSRPIHSNKEVEAALRYAQSRGWKIRVGSGHCWGKIYCPWNNSDCRCGEFCITSIWSTPKNPGNFARQIKRTVDNCSGRCAVNNTVDSEIE